MDTPDLPDMYTHSPWDLGTRIKQISRSHVTTTSIKYLIEMCLDLLYSIHDTVPVPEPSQILLS